jgi:hypothetical protein
MTDGQVSARFVNERIIVSRKQAVGHRRFVDARVTVVLVRLVQSSTLPFYGLAITASGDP